MCSRLKRSQRCGDVQTGEFSARAIHECQRQQGLLFNAFAYAQTVPCTHWAGRVQRYADACQVVRAIRFPHRHCRRYSTPLRRTPWWYRQEHSSTTAHWRPRWWWQRRYLQDRLRVIRARRLAAMWGWVRVCGCVAHCARVHARERGQCGGPAVREGGVRARVAVAFLFLCGFPRGWHLCPKKVFVTKYATLMLQCNAE